MSVTPARDVRPRRRGPLAAAGVGLVAVGLTVTALGLGPVGDALGDALYAALIWVVLALLAGRRSVVQLTVAAVLVCAAVELAQLTGIPAGVTAAWPPARYVLGTTFAAPDLLAYAVGAVAAGAVARAAGAAAGSRRAPAGGGGAGRIPLEDDRDQGTDQGKA